LNYLSVNKLIKMGVVCCTSERKDPDNYPEEGSQVQDPVAIYETVNAEEAYMVQKQIDLRLH
jgi:hypothetical protein